VELEELSAIFAAAYRVRHGWPDLSSGCPAKRRRRKIAAPVQICVILKNAPS